MMSKNNFEPGTLVSWGKIDLTTVPNRRKAKKFRLWSHYGTVVKSDSKDPKHKVIVMSTQRKKHVVPIAEMYLQSQVTFDRLLILGVIPFEED
jgi:hypothetical protein